MKCVYNHCVQSCVFYLSIPFPSICNQSIPICLSTRLDNRYQSITIRMFAIDWSSIINMNRLIDIDWYRLISIVIDWITRDKTHRNLLRFLWWSDGDIKAAPVEYGMTVHLFCHVSLLMCELRAKENCHRPWRRVWAQYR